MVNSKDSSIKQSGYRQVEESSCSPQWLKALLLASSLGLTSSGLAAADVLEAEVTSPSSPSEASVVEPLSASTSVHQGSPSVPLNLSAPTVNTAQPSFSPPPATTPVAPASPPHVTQSMQPPVPPPTAAAIVIPAPAAIPTMAESLLQPARSPLANATPSAESGTPSAASNEPSGAAVPAAPPLAVPDQIAADESVPAGYNSVFIDPTNYNVGATQAPVAAPNVVFSERATGCQITIASGQPTSSCGGGGGAANGSGTSAGSLAAGAAGGGGRGIPVGPVTVSPRGVSLGSTTVVSREFLNEKIRPLNVLRRGNEEYVFPLSIPSAISSAFGWRMHPIHQSWRFHSGTDLAAPMGTPVLATQAGRVSVADFLGGYGLTVILRHGDGNLESRYAHLSQVAVRSGEWVEQGEVIGLVGSTGTSTGPHLHFEVRQLTSEGWVAMDPAEVLEYGIANLLNILDNPMLALGRAEGSGSATVEESEAEPVDYPFRPAQPNAS